ncbi:MAG: bifunctional [glutamine synthetase] adenylyltransferase/[glutamine synthetase]-adenylyl-L-tyrosine phosphorylase [Acidimicrobiia bacterium]|nr:bifunctional [glutamine synthetase] adenylyltransferase/[glutamine synthetase]-adenylyl-L-tyrosine phosphorylase [bacterium]MXW57375.1 bifunctional [glutamine synthetase] adenylyltransferase/[glutamine synthetase]-adenylyl-L-tyrosine phosphorylase [Acidimicrobiia bacterium]MYB73360.1 bifunctional [glutamine synthetase] adenylyltransferase/[glutamine synthetase]-adenylyl-L-tyrosine phosphorylase [Acidimicrobiia bacterium]MYH98235.1 bifunctional [glutamine synthetase] adenylyltransferase/[gluta
MEASSQGRQNQDIESLIASCPWPADARSLIDDLGITDERRARAAAMLAGASRSMSKAVRRDPSLLGVLDPPSEFATEKMSLVAPDDDDSLDGLRRWKRRQLLRIALRDLLGEADLATVGRELSLLADACFVRALEIADEGPPLAIIGMGKLGGNELNYASDVDIVFAHEGDSAAAARRARKVLEILTAFTPEGQVYRVDIELRPEGGAGALSRTPEAFGTYFDRWAVPWERQAYIKTRLSAGDPELGNAFFDAIKPGVWGENLEADTVPHLRALKLRVEESAKLKGDRELKKGPGGLRDIEFTVQLLQLVHGRTDPTIRSPNTLTALRQLSWGEYIDQADAVHFTTAYIHLRTVEHRVQLRDERQTHELPTGEADQVWAARASGFESLEAFQASHLRHQTSVREIHQRIFYRQTLDRMHETGLVSELLPDHLGQLGFEDPDRAAGTIERLTENLGRRANVMQQVLVIMVEALATTPDPDLGLIRLAWLLDGSFRVGTILPVLRDSPIAISDIARLLGSSRVAAGWMRNHPEFARLLMYPEELAISRTAGELTADATEAMQSAAGDHDLQMAELRRFVRREQLRVAARDILGLASIIEIPEELTIIADAAVAAAVDGLAPEVPFAVIGLGRYGGLDLSYASDLDVIFVYEGANSDEARAANRTARGLLREIGAQTAEGRAWEIDARLRPEGENGQLARSLGGYERYYAERGQLWERQALLKRRFVAGDPDVGNRFLQLADQWCYQPEFSETEVEEIRTMKRRIEAERLGAGSKARDVKLGAGGLSDIEFTVQLMQLQHGFGRTTIRDNRTLPAIVGLSEHNLLDIGDRATLDVGYRFCQRFRNARYHLSGLSSDVFPDDDHEELLLARRLGYPSNKDLEADYQEITEAVREVTDRLLYGEDA